HVAEAEARLRGGQELVLVEVLAAKDAVDVGDRDLDLLVLGAGDLFQDRVVLGHESNVRIWGPWRNGIYLQEARDSSTPTMDGEAVGGHQDRKVRDAGDRDASQAP